MVTGPNSKVKEKGMARDLIANQIYLIVPVKVNSSLDKGTAVVQGVNENMVQKGGLWSIGNFSLFPLRLPK